MLDGITVRVWAVPEGIANEGRDWSACAPVAGVAAYGAAVGEPEAGLKARSRYDLEV